MAPKIKGLSLDAIAKQYGIKKLDKRPEWLKLLISGPSGQGKTSIIGTASYILQGWDEPRNVLYLEYDPSGSDTFYDMNILIDKVTPDSYSKLTGLLEAIKNNDTPYDVIAVDPYNGMQTMLEREIIAEETTSQKQNARKGTLHDTEKMELSDYNKLLFRLEKINDLLVALPKHVIVTCITELKPDPLDSVHKKREDKDLVLSLLLDGKMAHLLSAQFSLHGIIRKIGNGSNIETQTQFSLPNSESKSRFRNERTVSNLTFPDLLEEMGIDNSNWDLKWTRDSKGFVASYE